MKEPKIDNVRILLVDEDAAFQRHFGAQVEPYGMEVISAVRGADALTQYRVNEGHFKAVIINHRVSGFDGAHLVRQFQDQGYYGRVILISERMSKNDFLTYRDCGLSGFFSKPFDVSLLAEMLLRDG